jgi:hypothetical protein
MTETRVALLQHEYATRYEGNEKEYHGNDYVCDWLHVDSKLVADRAGRDEELTRRTYEYVLPDMQNEVAILIEQVLA